VVKTVAASQKTPLRNEFLTPPNSPVREKRIPRKTQMQNSFSSVSGRKLNPPQASEVNVNPFSLSPTTTIQKSIRRKKILFFYFFASGDTRRVLWEIWSRPLPDSLGFFSLSLSRVSVQWLALRILFFTSVFVRLQGASSW
jgi:hypothetical protein